MSLNHSSCIDYILVSAVNDVKSFTVLDPNINFSDHLPLRVDLLIHNNENTLQDTENKNRVDKSTSYTMPQLRWEKADRASYYFYTDQQLQPVLSYVFQNRLQLVVFQLTVCAIISNQLIVLRWLLKI